MQAVLLFGGNLGEVETCFIAAQRMIEERIGAITWLGRLARSQAWGYESEKVYRNQIIICQTTLAPLELLEALEEIERLLGRTDKGGENWADPSRSYADRTIDIDILYLLTPTAEQIHVDTPKLVVPHPKIMERGFVIELLRECKVLSTSVNLLFTLGKC